MKIDSYYVLGAMSGTSVDGLDLCYAHFECHENWKFKIINSDTLEYSKEWISKLSNAVDLSSAELMQLDIDYSHFLADQMIAFIDKHQITNLDVICSHGHTVLHQPYKKLTYQIGNLELLAKRLEKIVVCNFRIQDVALGGQGAPLVPIGDRLLFQDYDICLNLGGFANLSYEKNGHRVAFDVCPANCVLNAYAKKLGSEYDAEGQLSREGSVNRDLLSALNQLDYYDQQGPKSLGIEWVLNTMFPLIDTFNISVHDILRTLVEHMAVQLSKGLNFIKASRILVSGGGVYNTFLMERIKLNTEGEIVIPSKEIIDFKEALIFGFLGVLKLRNEINCLQSVTGAQKDHSSGVVFMV